MNKKAFYAIALLVGNWHWVDAGYFYGYGQSKNPLEQCLDYLGKKVNIDTPMPKIMCAASFFAVGCVGLWCFNKVSKTESRPTNQSLWQATSVDPKVVERLEQQLGHAVRNNTTLDDKIRELEAENLELRNKITECNKAFDEFYKTAGALEIQGSQFKQQFPELYNATDECLGKIYTIVKN